MPQFPQGTPGKLVSLKLYAEASPSPSSPNCTALHCAHTMGRALKAG